MEEEVGEEEEAEEEVEEEVCQRSFQFSTAHTRCKYSLCSGKRVRISHTSSATGDCGDKREKSLLKDETSEAKPERRGSKS